MHKSSDGPPTKNDTAYDTVVDLSKRLNTLHLEKVKRMS